MRLLKGYVVPVLASMVKADRAEALSEDFASHQESTMVRLQATVRSEALRSAMMLGSNRHSECLVYHYCLRLIR